MVATIKEGSDCIGKPVKAFFPPEQDNEIDLVAVFRGVKLLFPTHNLHLQADDRLLLIASTDAWQKYQKHFVPDKALEV